MTQSAVPIVSALTGAEIVKLASPGAVDNFTTTQDIANLAAGGGQVGSFSTLTTSGAATFGGTMSFSGAMVDLGATITSSTAGFSLVMANNKTSLAISLTQTAATGSVTLPAAPVNHQLARLSWNQDVTALTVTASTTSTLIKFAPSAASTASAGSLTYIYQTSDTTWYRY